jgi:formylglycine-generating enzyme required for sulfatase activity
MVFRPIPEGGFRMGSRDGDKDEEPRHLVRITRHFWVAETPVTQTQLALWTDSPEYEEWLKARGPTERHDNGFPGNPDHPAERVTWHEAAGFCAWINHVRPPRLPDDVIAALPSEAGWEYACRAGTETDYCSGDGPGALEKVGWSDANSGGRTQPVRQKAANDWGLYDMHGNVWEWCRDAWDAAAYRRAERCDGVADPEVTEEMVGQADPVRVVRGGSWVIRAWHCRSAFRDGWWPGNRFRDRGFRVCLFPGP